MNCLKYGGLVLSLMFLSGCASVSVRSTERTHYQPAPELPKIVYVKHFATPDENFRLDRNREASATLREGLSQSLVQQLKTRLDRHLVPAEVVPRDFVPVQGSAWLIEGRFDRVEQGSRALRALLGLGTGGTKVETTVTVYDLSTDTPTPFLQFKTTGGSNAMPGAIANVNPVMFLPTVVGVVGGVAGGVTSGLGADVKRTAREIVATLSDYAAQRGMIPEKQAMRAKPLGSATFRLSDPLRPVNNPTSPDPSP